MLSLELIASSYAPKSLSLLLINCTSNTIIKKPDNLIPKNQMVDVLTDMFLASGGENIKNIHLQRKVNYFPLVFEKHHIDSTQFKESNFYYVWILWSRSFR